MKQIRFLLIIILLLICVRCRQIDNHTKNQSGDKWETKLAKEIPFLGHRNWILVVDKACPEMNSSGILMIDTQEGLLPVLQQTLNQIQLTTHIKPILFTDVELNYITEKQVPEIEKYKTDLFKIIPKSQTKTLLHDSLFTYMSKTSELFKVIILKTDQLIPYSSVFINLDCKYWNKENERQLRDSIKKHL